MQDYLDKIVVMEHSFSYDKHVIAKVVNQTKATVVVRYWNPRRETWDDEEKTRRLAHSMIITTILGSEIPDPKVKLIHEHLVSAQAERDRRIKANKATYTQFVKDMKCQ